LAITGTKYLVAGPVYPDALKRQGIDFLIPDVESREKLDEIIMQELVKGVFREDSQRYFNRVGQEMKDRGCDAVVLGCTEIPLLVDVKDYPLPVLDSTRLLARAAIREAIETRKTASRM
jgi:aspartate racemase